MKFTGERDFRARKEGRRDGGVILCDNKAVCVCAFNYRTGSERH